MALARALDAVHTGAWHLTATVTAPCDPWPAGYASAASLAHPVMASDAQLPGPLVTAAPGQDPRWLARLGADGMPHPLWLFGACRAWVVASDPHGAAWSRCEGIDRLMDLFPALRAGGYNLLNQWMAPWEYLLVHRDRAEHWRGVDGHWDRHAIPSQAAWSPWSTPDQGRAAAFDALVRQCGADGIALLLSPLPHQIFQMSSHAWGRTGSGWSVEDDHNGRPPEQLNGFSAFRSGMDAWDFFAADPSLPTTDWRAQLFDAQANLVRYLVARWSASSAIGMWVLIDELDGIGDEQGQLATRSGWWKHPQCDRWLATMVRLFRGRLTRSDGLAYAGDPYRHPLHAATTSFLCGYAPGTNLAWDGGPADARIDVIGWHWYPDWSDKATYDEVWQLTIDGIVAFAAQPGASARLISEFGAADRSHPDEAPSSLYPTLYHIGIWASLLSGQAGTVMNSRKRRQGVRRTARALRSGPLRCRAALSHRRDGADARVAALPRAGRTPEGRSALPSAQPDHVRGHGRCACALALALCPRGLGRPS